MSILFWIVLRCLPINIVLYRSLNQRQSLYTYVRSLIGTTYLRGDAKFSGDKTKQYETTDKKGREYGGTKAARTPMREGSDRCKWLEKSWTTVSGNDSVQRDSSMARGDHHWVRVTQRTMNEASGREWWDKETDLNEWNEREREKKRERENAWLRYNYTIVFNHRQADR